MEIFRTFLWLFAVNITMMTVWSLCVCSAVHHVDIISHLHHSRHYHCRLLHADRHRHLAPVILHYDHSSRRVKQQTTSQSYQDFLVHVGYTCIQTIQSWTWGPILLDPIQLNPQTYWPNQIQSTLNSSIVSYRIVSWLMSVFRPTWTSNPIHRIL